MGENQVKRGVGTNKYNNKPIDGPKNKSSEEQFLLNILKETTQRLKKEYGYLDEQILTVCSAEDKKVVLVPAYIFAQNLSPAEAIAKYLKEEYDFNYHEIGEIIDRNERGVWANYQRALKKMPNRFETIDDKVDKTISVPVTIFQNNEMSIFESLVSYMKDKLHLKNSKIAKLINKNPSNIWTIYQRAKKKENEVISS